MGGGSGWHPGFTEGSRKFRRRKCILLPASVFGEVGCPTSRYAGSLLGILMGTVALLSSSSAKNLTSLTEGKKPFFPAANWASTKCFPGVGESPLCQPRCLWSGSTQGFGSREVEDHRPQAVFDGSPSGFHGFTDLVCLVLSALCTHCGAHIFPQVLNRGSTCLFW